MKLPFSVQQFFELFRDYNDRVWPLQIFLLALALICIALVAKQKADRIVSAIIAFLWAWMGIVYHLIFFARINPAAQVFAALFLIQAFVIFWFGVRRDKLRYKMRMSIKTALGGALLLYALLIYPLLGYRFGHVYPNNPTFGVPCPTTIFTIGLFFFLETPFPKSILIIPAIWTVIGTSAAVLLRVPEDFGLTFAGVMLLFLGLRSVQCPRKT